MLETWNNSISQEWPPSHHISTPGNHVPFLPPRCGKLWTRQWMQQWGGQRKRNVTHWAGGLLDGFLGKKKFIMGNLLVCFFLGGGKSVIYSEYIYIYIMFFWFFFCIPCIHFFFKEANPDFCWQDLLLGDIFWHLCWRLMHTYKKTPTRRASDVPPWKIHGWKIQFPIKTVPFQRSISRGGWFFSAPHVKMHPQTGPMDGGPVAKTTFSEWLKLHWTGGALCEMILEFWKLYIMFADLR